MWLIVGLGNPGVEYARTRHNAGFMAVDVLAAASRAKVDELVCYSLVGRGRLAGAELVLAKPVTFMNRSGEAVRCLVERYGLDLSRLLVVYDDMDLPTGTVRLKQAGGSGGHRGMESIIGALGTSQFGRLRIGIGKPPKGAEVDYVLSPFADAEEELVRTQLERLPELVGALVTRGYNYAMSTFNRRADGAIEPAR